ncbi:MAG: type II toxin-antitoxin system HicA family toxin [Clostridiales bacterium]|nr:type II toxin-antitoxin system HicA family toxin [Clostridiales bacterium]
MKLSTDKRAGVDTCLLFCCHSCIMKRGEELNKTYLDVMSGKCDNAIRFVDFQNLIVDLGFEFKRQKGSHTMYYHGGIHAFMNIQKDGSKAKGYEVRQLRKIIEDYNLHL